MEQLITHLLENNLEEIKKKSLLNCHCIGLHSIMLLEAPGKTIRLYITEENHQLYKNGMDYINEQSIAYHPHHCNLTIHCVYGSLVNITVQESHNDNAPLFNKYLYKSEISDGEMKFHPQGEARIEHLGFKTVGKGESITMKAKDIHTVFCSKGTINAWLVYEGKEDETYNPICYTKKDLNNESSEGLYIPMNENQIRTLLKKVKLN